LVQTMVCSYHKALFVIMQRFSMGLAKDCRSCGYLHVLICRCASVLAYWFDDLLFAGVVICCRCYVVVLLIRPYCVADIPDPLVCWYASVLLC